MALQKVEFEFPDPDRASDTPDFEEKDDGSFVLKVEGRAADEEAKREKLKARAKEDDLDIEIVDHRHGAFRRRNGRVFREGAQAPPAL